MKPPKKQKLEFSLDTVLKNPVIKKQLEGYIEEIVMCKSKIRTEAESLKDIISEAHESLGIPGKVLNKLVKEKLDPGSIDAEVIELEEIQHIAEGLGYTEAP